MNLAHIERAALDSNDLSAAIIQKSKAQMQSILKQNPHSIDQANRWGQTPLHLALRWPWAVDFLIRNGANLDSHNNEGETPLLCALAHGCAEAVGLLMRAGCSLSSNRLYCPLDVTMGWPEALRGPGKAAWSIFIASLAERRRQLYSSLATIPIPDGTRPCWAHNDRVLDAHLDCAEDACQSYDVFFGHSARLAGIRTVYHLEHLTAEMAQELWQVGFRDMDLPDRWGQTPVSKWRADPRDFSYPVVLRTVELVGWLVQKGACIYHPIRSFGGQCEPRLDVADLHPETRALHHIAANIGREMGGTAMRGAPADHLLCLRESSTQLLTTLFSSPSRDGCLCACSC